MYDGKHVCTVNEARSVKQTEQFPFLIETKKIELENVYFSYDWTSLRTRSFFLCTRVDFVKLHI